MSESESSFSRPERVVLVLARKNGDCRGKAIRIANGEEYRFHSAAELATWLANLPNPLGPEHSETNRKR